MSRHSGHLRRSVGGLLFALPIAVGLSLAAQQPAPTTALADRPLAPPKVRVNRTVPKVAPPRTTFAFSERPTVAEVFAARAFGEPLVPVGGTPSDAETAALSRALLAYTQGATAGSVEPLRAFLAQYPGTAWRASLQLNLGVRYRAAGAYARALASWDEAWRLAKAGTDAHPRAVADLAIAEWLLLNASLGQTQRVTERLSELDGRQVRGPAAVKIQEARELVAIITRYPDKVVSSGPSALQVILEEQKRPVPTALAQYRPTAAGTSLLQLRDLARAANSPMRMVRRDGATDIPIPSIVHWSVGHYSAIVEQQGEQFRIVDRGMGGTYWMDRATLLEETSGHFMVAEPRASQPAGDLQPVGGWVDVDDGAAATVVGHSCPPGGPPPNEPPECPCGSSGMVTYAFHPVNASLRLIDSPVGYAPPRGPTVYFRLTYHQREQLQPQIFSSSHLGPKWMADWLRYLQEEPTDIYGVNPPHVWVLMAGGGREVATGPSAGVYPASWRSKATIVKVSETPLRYERRLSDGTVEVFAAADAAPIGQRRVYLTEIVDPQQQTVTLTWDAQYRLTAITDAIGQVTTLGYADGADPLRITSVTDPFGRTATFTYNGLGQLETITDVIGMVSRMDYGAEDFVAALTTPYGTTAFRHEHYDEFVYRFIEATDPLGGTERLEFRWYTTDLPATEASTEVPTGFTAHNAGLNDFNTLYWDKLAWSRAPTSVTAATITRWLVKSELPTTPAFSTGVPHSVKRPLESRIWYAYPGQGGPGSAGTWSKPSTVARVLDDGSSQIWASEYNAKGYRTKQLDPLGRETTYEYDTSGLNVVAVRQKNGATYDLLETRSYDGHTEPVSITDAAGQTTTYAYDAHQQPVTITNAKNETATYGYDASGYLTTIAKPASGAVTTLTYDDYGRVRTRTDADNYSITTEYDALDRPVRKTFPDGSFAQTVYRFLDPEQRRDRLGRWTRYTYDSARRLTSVRDPLGRIVTQEWCTCGALEALIDGNGNRTRWERDVQGRVTHAVRANGAQTTYLYEATNSRLKRVTDAKGQEIHYTYFADNRVGQTSYTNAAIATPAVTFTYDAAYGRMTTVSDAIGTTQYGYYAVTIPAVLGASQLASVDGPLPNDTITYAYDEIGRLTSRSNNGVPVTWTFDTLGRAVNEVNVLGTFTYTYEGATNRLSTVAYANGQTTTYTYLGNSGDRRLQTIHNKYPNGTTLSRFDYAHDAVGNILSWRQQSDLAAVTWELGFDAADQLTTALKKSTDPTPLVLKRYAYAYDPAGNRTAEQIDDRVIGASHNALNEVTSQQPAGPVRFEGTVSEAATVTIAGQPVTVSGDNRFMGSVSVSSGTNTATVAATDASGNTSTKTYEFDSSGAAKTLTYDANGNVTSDGARSFEWDAANRLTRVLDGGVELTRFTYDALGRRVGETVAGVTRSYVYDHDQVIEERDSTNAVKRRWFADGVQVDGASLSITRDHLGSVIDVVGSTGSLAGRAQYDPFGRREQVVQGPDVRESFSGHLFSSDSSLLLTKHRVYDPALGRWLSQDPSGIDQGINLYAYAANNPIGNVDALGLAISCNAKVREVGPKGVPSARCKTAGGCTGVDNVDGALTPCQQDKCGKTFGFDALVDLSLLVEYNVDPNLPSKETPGKTLRQHEMLHVQDFTSTCKTLDGRIKTEGFASRSACNSALQNFWTNVYAELARTSDRSRQRRDGKK